MNLIKFQNTKLINRNIFHYYTLTVKDHKEQLIKQLINLGINLLKETKSLYSENCKILMKEIKDDANRWRDTHVLVILTILILSIQVADLLPMVN